MPVPLLATLEAWLTPLWLLSLGVTAGALILLALLVVVWLISRPLAGRITGVLQEGPLMPLSYVVLAFVCLCVLGAGSVNNDQIVPSLKRLSAVGLQSKSVEAPPRSEDHEVSVSFRSSELTRYSIQSDQDVQITTEPGQAYKQYLPVEGGEQALQWSPSSPLGRFFVDEVSKVYVTNDGDLPAHVLLEFQTDVLAPEVHHLPYVVGSVVGVYLVYLILYGLLPSISTIAIATSKEAMGQPLFLLFLILGATALLIFIYVPYNTFGEDVKMLKDSGMTTIMILAILFALWTASASVADEIEGKTALTLLSKPISRRQFILGKFLGILWPVLVIFVVLGSLLLATVSYKVVYDARESSNPQATWQECHHEVVQVVPGLVLALLETVVLAALSVAISTRLPIIPNLIICGALYAIGHLTPLIAQSSVGANEFVAFFAKLVAVVLPVLDHFNIQASVAGGRDVPIDYLLWATGYCVLYSTLAMLLALILFEDRDLA